MAREQVTIEADETGPLDTFQQFFSLKRSTLVLSLAMFAFSGLRFAGLPAHKALIVGPAERGVGGRITGSYYFVRGAIVIISLYFDRPKRIPEHNIA